MTHDKTNQSNDRVHFSVTKRALFGVACALMGGMVFAAGTSFATLDNDPGTSDVLGSKLIVPYDGFLMLDSQAVDGAVKIKFDLHDVASGGSSVWTETQIVTAYQGRFSIRPGSRVVV